MPNDHIPIVGTRKPDDDVGAPGAPAAAGGRQSAEQSAITEQGSGGKTDADRNADWDSAPEDATPRRPAAPPTDNPTGPVPHPAREGVTRWPAPTTRIPEGHARQHGTRCGQGPQREDGRQARRGAEGREPAGRRDRSRRGLTLVERRPTGRPARARRSRLRATLQR